MRTVEEIRAIEDPYDRARVACETIAALETTTDELRDVRDFAFQELHFQRKESLRAIATRYGVSKSLVAGATG